MELEQCTIHFNWAVTGKALTTFTCRGDENAGILHSYVSNWLQLGPERIALHIDDVLVPGVTSQNVLLPFSVMTITSFRREVNISCVLLGPQHCPYCQNLKSLQRGTFIEGVVPYAYLYQRQEPCSPHDDVWRCYCNQKARETGRRCHRSWWYLIRKIGKKANLACVVLEQFYWLGWLMIWLHSQATTSRREIDCISESADTRSDRETCNIVAWTWEKSSNNHMHSAHTIRQSAGVNRSNITKNAAALPITLGSYYYFFSQRLAYCHQILVIPNMVFKWDGHDYICGNAQIPCCFEV